MLVDDWHPRIVTGPPAGSSEEKSWSDLLREFAWIHRQMEHSLRATFAPVFLLFELKTLVLGLRNKAVENAAAVEALLGQSLLSAEVKEVLRAPGNARSTIADLASELAVAGEGFGHLAAVYAKSGLRGFENGLLRAFLEAAAGQRRHRVIDEFFVAFADLRNVIILYKHLRWEMDEPAPFVTGGRVEGVRLARILAQHSASDFDRLVKDVTGLPAAAEAEDEAALETVLLRAMTQQLRRTGRESEDIGVILDYLWRVYVQARNLAVLHHGADVAVERLERELIA